LEPLIPQYDAILMSNHGVVTYGRDLQYAYMKMETVEHFAKISLVTHVLGRQHELGAREIEKLIEARNRYQGTRSAAPMPVQTPCREAGNHHGRLPDFDEEVAATPPRRVPTRQR
jgi:hypothetical protein